MKCRGQTAFETLFLFAIILSAAIVTISFYTAISDDTTALSIARAETNKQLATIKENIQIEEIHITNGVITITLSQNFLAFKTDPIKQSIAKQTAYKNIIINVLP